jgi:hypothetical protein
MRKLILTATVTIVLGVTGAAQLKTPADWKWRTDTPATVTDNDNALPADKWFYVGMPPGWHITTNPGVLLYHPAHEGKANFTLQSEIFLFPGANTGSSPGENNGEYGLFISGRGLDSSSAEPSYMSFVLRRDGQHAVQMRAGSKTTTVIDWRASRAVVPQSGTEAAKNVLKVDVSPTLIVFSANGTDLARVPFNGGIPDGAVGLRVGKSLNLHVSTFDLTHRLAPAAVKK